MNGYDRRWLAGLFEGEGTCGIYAQRNARTKKPYLGLASTDRDVLQTAQTLTEAGGIVLNRPATTRTKALYIWQVQKRADVLRICRLLYPHLHARRASQMRAVMDWCETA